MSTNIHQEMLPGVDDSEEESELISTTNESNQNDDLEREAPDQQQQTQNDFGVNFIGVDGVDSDVSDGNVFLTLIRDVHTLIAVYLFSTFVLILCAVVSDHTTAVPLDIDCPSVKVASVVQLSVNTIWLISIVAFLSLKLLERARTVSSLLYTANKVFCAGWFCTTIYSSIITLIARKKHDGYCIDDAPYAVSALTILIELHAVAVVLAIVMAVCSALFLAFRIRVLRGLMVPADVGTDRAVIDALETVEYTPESIPKEDAKCGICLCDYAIGDTIRFLPCGHHFHASCVDVWLASHRTCPFCLHDVTDPTAPQWQHHTAQRPRFSSMRSARLPEGTYVDMTGVDDSEDETQSPASTQPAGDH